MDSYLSRLAAANHITTSDLATYLDTRLSTVATAVVLPALATASGQPAAVLAHALPQLRDQYQRLTGAAAVGAGRIRPWCRRCAAARGITMLVQVWSRPERKVCTRHQLWVGDGVSSTAEQLDLAAHPEVVHAQLRHHRLVRRFGPNTIEVAYRCAQEAWVEVTWRGYRQPYRRIRTLHQPDAAAGWRIHTEDPTYQAANYPETVILAGLIAQPRWRHLATSDSNMDNDRFDIELWRRLPPHAATIQPRLRNLRALVRHAAHQAGWLAQAATMSPHSHMEQR